MVGVAPDRVAGEEGMIDVFEDRRQRERELAEQRAAAVAFFGESYTRNMPLPKATKATRPMCACCGKRYGERRLGYENKQFAIGTPITSYQGNLHVVYESLSVGYQMGPDHSPGASLTRHTWDGVSYRSRAGTDPFCTTTCAVKFAQAAHRAGYRMGQ